MWLTSKNYNLMHSVHTTFDQLSSSLLELSSSLSSSSSDLEHIAPHLKNSNVSREQFKSRLNTWLFVQAYTHERRLWELCLSGALQILDLIDWLIDCCCFCCCCCCCKEDITFWLTFWLRSCKERIGCRPTGSAQKLHAVLAESEVCFINKL